MSASRIHLFLDWQRRARLAGMALAVIAAVAPPVHDRAVSGTAIAAKIEVHYWKTDKCKRDAASLLLRLGPSRNKCYIECSKSVC